ncbi:DUF1636 family protein [Roseovarius aestuarii]|uniref:Metal-binding protein n=1 Tax=Roseovarius aestuarii TaxID=475083 RepID=A0A1X7BU79_9RHOB|nr:DUF1636 family protein [Roseovarius aestuarii]SMC13134.1 hypothetical protein ROA7745_02969 [Roseovarius aestuarii]
MTDASDHLVLVCSACNGGLAAKQVCDALAPRLPTGLEIRLVKCMAGCERPLTVGFQAPEKAQYLFGDIRDASDLDALVQFACQYQQSTDGWTNATDRPPALLAKTLARLPRIDAGAVR